MMMKAILNLIITAIVVTNSSVSMDKYDRKIISYWYEDAVQAARFFGDKFVSTICNDNMISGGKEIVCTFHLMKRVHDKFEDMKTCMVEVPPGFMNYFFEREKREVLDPFGPDHVLFSLTYDDFIVVNINDCSYAMSGLYTNYTEDLATIGVDLKKVFLGSWQSFLQMGHGTPGEWTYLGVPLGFDYQENWFSRLSGYLNPLTKEAEEEYLKVDKTEGGSYVYDRDHGLQKIQDNGSGIIQEKSNNYISNFDHNRFWYVNQFDLNGKLKLSYNVTKSTESLNPGTIYNLPGGGFLLTYEYFTPGHWSESYLIKVDANGHLVDKTKFTEMYLSDARLLNCELYKNDANMDCVLYAEDFHSIQQLHISVKCYEAESITQIHAYKSFFIFLSVFLSLCLVACLIICYHEAGRYLSSRCPGSDSENTSQTEMPLQTISGSV